MKCINSFIIVAFIQFSILLPLNLLYSLNNEKKTKIKYSGNTWKSFFSIFFSFFFSNSIYLYNFIFFFFSLNYILQFTHYAFECTNFIYLYLYKQYIYRQGGNIILIKIQVRFFQLILPNLRINHLSGICQNFDKA